MNQQPDPALPPEQLEADTRPAALEIILTDEAGRKLRAVTASPEWVMDAVLGLHERLQDVLERWTREQSKDGGHMAYVHSIGAFCAFLDRLHPLFDRGLKNPLVRLAADLHDVRERGIVPVAFRPRRPGGGAAPGAEIERNALAAAALHLHELAGDPLHATAVEMARDMTKAGHARQPKGRGGAGGITASTLKGWRDWALNDRAGAPPAPHKEAFDLYVKEGAGHEREHALALRRLLRLHVPAPPPRRE